MPVPRIFITDDSEVPEGSNHEYFCTLVDLGVAIQAAAITSVRIWLDGLDANDVPTALRSDIDAIGAGIATITSGTGGVGEFLLKLTAADSAVVAANAGEIFQRNRLTLKFIYSRVGGGTGQLTHEVVYRVRNLHRIS